MSSLAFLLGLTLRYFALMLDFILGLTIKTIEVIYENYIFHTDTISYDWSENQNFELSIDTLT